MFPRKLRVYEDRERVLEIDVVEFSPASDSPTQSRRRSASAFQVAPCKRSGPVVPLNKIAPEYPEVAKMSRVQGRVLLYAFLSDEGKVQKAEVIRSAGTALDQAAMHAVQQWVYPPTDCGSGHPLPTEIEVQVNFVLSY